MSKPEPTVNTEPLSPELSKLLAEAWAQTDFPTRGVVDTLGRPFYPRTLPAVTGHYGESNCGIFWCEILRRYGWCGWGDEPRTTWTMVGGTKMHIVRIVDSSGMHVEPAAAMLTAVLKYLRARSSAPMGTKCLEWLEVCRS